MIAGIIFILLGIIGIIVLLNVAIARVIFFEKLKGKEFYYSMVFLFVLISIFGTCLVIAELTGGLLEEMSAFDRSYMPPEDSPSIIKNNQY
ncbi:MAG: hypothetical protein P1P85_01235 [Patescibacteria group bacterium]|nr:hypothetical protein [Patescibacteria group bacterium]